LSVKTILVSQWHHTHWCSE